MSILLLETIHADAQVLLNQSGAVQYGGPDSPLPDRITLDTVEAIITRGRGHITDALMARCPRLKVIARCGAGLDNLDLQAAAERNIPVVYAPGKTSSAVAEHTMMLMLSLARRLSYLAHEVRMGNWAVRSTYEGLELRGKTVGLVGLGSIGLSVASLARAFGMDVIYSSRSDKHVDYPYVSLDEVLGKADFISLHTALTPETRHLLDAAKLSLIRPQAFLINTARGGLVDESALLKQLDEGQLAGYATDLLEADPPPSDHPLLNHPRTLITPHSAVLTDRTYKDICMSTVQNVLAILQGEIPEERSIYQ